MAEIVKKVEVVWACDEERERHYAGRRAMVMKVRRPYRGEGREEGLREDCWTK